MAAINVDGMFGAGISTLTIDTGQVTVSKRFNTIAAASGTVGTLETIALDSGVGTQLNGNLPDIFIRPAAGHFIAVQHAIPGTDPIYHIGSQTVNLNENQSLHLVRNFGSSSWLSNGISLTGGVLVDLTSVQTLTNKSLTSPNLTTPEVIGSLTHRGIVAGYQGAADVIAQVGTTIVGVTTGTAVSVTLDEETSMKIKASVLAGKSDHTESLYAEVTGLFRRASGGNIVLVGTTSPVTIGTSALALSLGVDTSAQAGNILVTGIAGTSHCIVDYTYNKVAQSA